MDAIAGSNPPQQLADEVHGGALAFLRTGRADWPACTADRLTTRRYDVPSGLLDDGYADVRPLLSTVASAAH